MLTDVCRKALRTVVLSDLDSTLCDTRHRWHLSPMRDPESSWIKYSLACGNDVPVSGTIAALRLAHPHHLVHLVSGRSDSARSLTEKWLYAHEVPYDELILREVGDRSSNGRFKVRHIHQLRAAGLAPVLFFEDWAETARYIEDNTGVPVVGVNPFYEKSLQDATCDNPPTSL